MKVATNQERLNELFDSDPRNLTTIAKELGVSKQSVSMWKSGLRSPKKTVLIRIAQMFNVSIDWLMGYDVERTPSGDHGVIERQIPIVVPDTERFVMLTHYMPEEDFQMVMAIFDRAEKRMREAEGGE